MNKRKRTAKRPYEADDKETLEAKKKKLSMEITILELYISQQEALLNTMGVRQQRSRPARSRNGDCTADSPSPSDGVKEPITGELLNCAGLFCEPTDDGLIISFLSQETFSLRDDYWVQLVKVGNNWKLKCCLMPEGLNVDRDLSAVSMDSSNDMIIFLRTCRRLVDCHNHRKQQFKELETFLSDDEYGRCSVRAESGSMKMSLKLAKLSPYSVKTRSIFIKLSYKMSETRPCIVESDCTHSQKLTHEQRKALRVFIKTNFKLCDLKDAVSKVFTSSDIRFLWMQVPLEPVVTDVSEDEVVDITSSSSPALLEITIDDCGNDVIQTFESSRSGNKIDNRNDGVTDNKRQCETRSLLRKNQPTGMTSKPYTKNKENFPFIFDSSRNSRKTA